MGTRMMGRRGPNYDSIAGTYDRRYVDNDYSGVERALIAFIGADPKGPVLEVGCGTGHWLQLLHQRGVRVAGADASKNMLDRARAKASDVALVRARAEHLPYAGRTFERLFCINALHHFEDKVAFLADAFRVLRPGGRLMTVGLDPHTGLDRWWLYDYFGPVLELDRRRYPPVASIRDWMHGVGFIDVRTSEVQHLPVRLSARLAIERGRLDKAATSQLAILTDQEYGQGIDRIHAAIEHAEARGESLDLFADLRLYATFGTAPSI